MAITVKHSKVSTIPDDTDTSLVRPSDWNADHTLVGLGTMAEQDANAVAITGGTITNVEITSPELNQINDTNGNEILGFSPTTSATDYLVVKNGIGVGVPLHIYADGSSSNIGLHIQPKGTGLVTISDGTDFNKGIRFRSSSSAASAITLLDAVSTAGRVVTLPDATTTLVGRNTTDTLTNKTLTSPVISGGTIDSAAIGATTPSTGKFSTLEATGTSTLGTALAQYIQVEGGATAVLLSAQGSGTNIPLALQPKGTGALQAQATTSTTAGGNVRGANAVDWQTSRGSAGQVASGSTSAIGGGANNTAGGAFSIVTGGAINSSAGFGSFVGGGRSNTAGGTPDYAAAVAGQGNTSLGFFNFIGGGFTNAGTSASAVTTQSGTMNGTTAVTLSGSNANIKVGQIIAGTSIATYTYVAAISGTSLTLSQAASGSSTSTLSFYTPHGVVVGGGNNQATGSYSFIGGGGDAGTAANRNVASGDWSFVGGGRGNQATGGGAVIAGGGTDGSNAFPNTATSTICTVSGGFLNNATAYGAVIIGGGQNTSNGVYSTILGGVQGTARGITGYTVFSATNTPVANASGVSQAALLVLGAATTDATATALRSNTSAAGTTNQIILPNNSAYLFKATVISNVTGGGNTSGWKLEGVIKRGANAASTTIVGLVTTTLLAQDAGAATWAIAATADTTNGGLRITFTGQAATTIRTVCKVETTEVTF